jgi:hypothetical protein
MFEDAFLLILCGEFYRKDRRSGKINIHMCIVQITIKYRGGKQQWKAA